jgi:hypothetical protein
LHNSYDWKTTKKEEATCFVDQGADGLRYEAKDDRMINKYIGESLEGTGHGRELGEPL